MVDINKLRLFKDGIGRLLIGEEIVERSNEKVLVIKNPLLIHMGADPKSGQLAINFFPEVFPEFLADKDSPTIWEYSKSNVSICDNVILDIKIHSHYTNVFNKAVQPPVEKKGEGTNLVKLFDN